MMYELYTTFKEYSCHTETDCPSINVQPKIYIPKCINLLDNSNPTVGTTSFLGEQNQKLFSIDFSIDYHFVNFNNLGEISMYFDLDGTEVSLNRYRKKNKINETNNPPKTIISSLQTTPEKKIVFYIPNTLENETSGELNTGCQYVSLIYTSHINNLKNLKECVKNISEIMFDEDLENSEEFGFSFIIQIKLTDSQCNQEYIYIKTNMFKFIFGRNGCTLRIKKVYTKDYQI